MNEKNTPPDAGAGHVQKRDSFQVAAIAYGLGLTHAEAWTLYSLSQNKPAAFRALITLANACATDAPDVAPLQLASAIDDVLTVAADSEGSEKVLRHLS